MTIFNALLILAIVACIAYLTVWHRRDLSFRDLSIQLLLTLLGTYLGVLASLETSRRLADEDLKAVVVGQTKIALTKLGFAKVGIDGSGLGDAYIDRRIEAAMPALERLASLDGAHRVLGLHAAGALDEFNYSAKRYVVEKQRAEALRSHVRDLWRLLAIRLAHATGDERLAHCNSSQKLRTCDAEIEVFLREALKDPNAPSQTAGAGPDKGRVTTASSAPWRSAPRARA